MPILERLVDFDDSGFIPLNDKELARPGPKSKAQTPAPPKGRIKGSKENPEGTAATRSKAGDIEISEANEQALKDKIAEMMGGIELGKYDGIDFTPPEGAREAAKRALDVREKKPASQKGMTPVGIARARDLIHVS